jgi:hypothetical protein
VRQARPPGHIVMNLSAAQYNARMSAEAVGRHMPPVVTLDPAHTVAMYRLDGHEYAVWATMPLAWVLNTSTAEHDLG